MKGCITSPIRLQQVLDAVPAVSRAIPRLASRRRHVLSPYDEDRVPIVSKLVEGRLQSECCDACYDITKKKAKNNGGYPRGRRHAKGKGIRISRNGSSGCINISSSVGGKGIKLIHTINSVVFGRVSARQEACLFVLKMVKRRIQSHCCDARCHINKQQ